MALLGCGAKNRRGYKPFGLGILAAGLVIMGKFILASDRTLYIGVALLVAASLWNAWPQRRLNSGSFVAVGSLSQDKETQNISERR